MSYRHTQVGLVTATGLGFATLGAGVIAAVTGHWIAIAMTAFMGVLTLLFGTLTTSVEDGVLSCAFGPGVIRRRIPLDRIADVSIGRSAWFYGWGIRLTPRGWLWRVSGMQHVEMEFVDGHRFCIGTDEPERLAEVIRSELATGAR
jgi:hypothetical protein